MKTFITHYFSLLILFCWVAFTSCNIEDKEEEKSPPNIIYIMSDDHAYQAISAYSGKLMQTPNIDRIANEGALFTRATVTNSICAPSRAVLLTGKHSFINGKIDNMAAFNWDQDNFPKLLQANGYQTAMIGKIHMDGIPQGFDFSMVLPGQGHYYNPDFLIEGERVTKEGYVTDIITDTTLDWLKNERDPEKPFCVLYHHKAPHREWEPAPRHYREFTKRQFEEPSTLFDDYEGRGTAAKEAEMNILHHMNWAGDSKLYPETIDKLGISRTVVGPNNNSWDIQAFERTIGRMNEAQRAEWDEVYGPINEDFMERYPDMNDEDLMHWRYQRYMQDYLGTIAAVDEGVGRVLDYLDEAGLAENTIVVYTSDQGFYLGEHGWFDKRFMYEESFRMPLMVRYPKEIEQGTVIDALVQNLDFAPTFLDYAGVNIPGDMQGESFRQLMNGEREDWKDAVYYTYYEYPSVHMVKRHYGVATDRYKLMHFYYDIDEWELYDLQEDPQELKNVYEDPAYEDIKHELHDRLEELRTQYGDSDELNQEFIDRHLSRNK
ncbi:sulfatase family protein [Pleomorphovibrio marinus]|uniref:sulfatase family protein n=1 Tax=Pleomorphovibrio marinus TaxID=2164132 RepID=UPI000E09E889|nr:sulfatase [Pleomorphovibrio marinus]